MSVGGGGGGGGQGMAIAANKRLFNRVRTESEQSSNSLGADDQYSNSDPTTKDQQQQRNVLAPVFEGVQDDLTNNDEKHGLMDYPPPRNNSFRRNNSSYARSFRGGEADEMMMAPTDEDVIMYEMIENGVPKPPDGGWGWVIVFASFACNLIVDGIAYTFGVFLPKFAQEFVPQSESAIASGKVENGNVPWVGSLLCGIYLCVGPIVSALTNKFGCRKVCIGGSIIAAAGFALSSLSPSLPMLMLSYGVIGGIGFGFIYLPAVVCVGYYFETKRAVATGIAVCGSGVGTFVFAPFATWLLEQTDWRMANLVLSALIFSCAIFGALMRPLEVERKPLEEGEGDDDNVQGGETEKGNVNHANRSLLHRMAEDKRNYLERGSIAGSAYFMVQLPDGTMERRLKLPLNVDPGVHSSFNLDQLVLPGSPLNTGTTTASTTTTTGAANTLAPPATQQPQQQPLVPPSSVGGLLPTITEAKVTENNASGQGSSEESSQGGSGELANKGTETDSAETNKTAAKSSAMNIKGNIEESPSNLTHTAPQSSNPIPIPESIREEGEFESRGTSYDSSEGVQLSTSATSTKRRNIRERRSSEGTSLSPPSVGGGGGGRGSDAFRGSPIKIMTAGPRKVSATNSTAPTTFVRIPRNESAPQFMYGRSIPKNGSVPLFDRMVARKHSFRAVPMGSSVIRNNSKPNLQERRSSKASIISGRNNNYANQLDEDYNSLWSRSELNEGLIFSTSQKSTEPRHIVRPLSRKDIFYSGSIAQLPEYQSTKDISSYRQSILNLPRASTAVSFSTAGDEGDGGEGGGGGGGGDLLPTSPSRKDLLAKPAVCPCLPCGGRTGAFKTALAQLMDFSLLKNPIFLFIAISNIFGMLGFYVPFVFLVGAAKDNGVPADIAAYLISIIGITNTIGRIVCGFLSDLPQVNSLLMNNLCILLSGLCVAVVPFCTSFGSYVTVSVFFGLFVSGYISLTSIILVDLLGLDNLTNAFGLLILFRGAASIVGPPVAGAVFDFFNSYDISFYLAGGFLVISALISFLIPCISKFAPPKPLLEPPTVYGGYYLEDIPEAIESPGSGDDVIDEESDNEIEKCDNIESSL